MTDRMDAFGGGCAADDCDEPTPWDMVGILVDETTGYCSPECAIDSLEPPSPPELVTLHDPQYVVDRDAVGGLPGDIIDFDRPVDGHEDAVDAIREAGQLFEREFRVSPNE